MYRFHFEDNWTINDNFICTVSPNSNTSLDLILTLVNPDGDEFSENNAGPGIADSINSADIEGFFGGLGSDSGTYYLIVEAVSGYSCTYPYTLECVYD